MPIIMTNRQSETERMDGYNCMRYAISDHPLGPWKYMGIYMEPSDCFTNQGSIVNIRRMVRFLSYNLLI